MVYKSVGDATRLMNNSRLHYEIVCSHCGHLGTLSKVTCINCPKTTTLVCGDEYEEVNAEVNKIRDEYSLSRVM